MNIETKYVAYYRVSTAKQGKSGLGLDAQREQVRRFVNCDDCIVAEFTEVESGKNNNRNELDKAIQLAKKENAVLIIAKLDRLSRNVAFIASLMDSGVKFKAVDNPEANEFTIHIFAALAQQERKFISERTKAGLAELKKKGVKLGKPENLTATSRTKAVESIKKKAAESTNNKQVMKFIQDEKAKGKTLKQIAESLNEHGYQTSRGKEFKTGTVDMLLKRMNSAVLSTQ